MYSFPILENRDVQGHSVSKAGPFQTPGGTSAVRAPQWLLHHCELSIPQPQNLSPDLCLSLYTADSGHFSYSAATSLIVIYNGYLKNVC